MWKAVLEALPVHISLFASPQRIQMSSRGGQCPVSPIPRGSHAWVLLNSRQYSFPLSASHSLRLCVFCMTSFYLLNMFWDADMLTRVPPVCWPWIRRTLNRALADGCWGRSFPLVCVATEAARTVTDRAPASGAQTYNLEHITGSGELWYRTLNYFCCQNRFQNGASAVSKNFQFALGSGQYLELSDSFIFAIF